MSDVNVVVMGGRLVADPELRKTADGKSVASLRLASGRRRGDKEYTTFVDISVFGKLADVVAEHKHKGDQVTVTGQLCLNSWETESGEKRSRLYVMANEVVFGPTAQNGKKAEKTEAASEAAEVEQALDEETPF